jgi:hypothetical protein
VGDGSCALLHPIRELAAHSCRLCCAFVHVHCRAQATVSTVVGRAWHSCSDSVVLVTHSCSAEVHLGWMSCQHQLSGWAGAVWVMACALLLPIRELAAHSCRLCCAFVHVHGRAQATASTVAGCAWHSCSTSVVPVTGLCSAEVHLGWLSCQHQLSGWARAMWVMALVHCCTLSVSWLRIRADCAAHSCMCMARLRPQPAQWLGVLGIHAALVWC